MKKLNLVAAASVAVASAIAAAPAFATPPDLTDLSAAVDFSTVGPAILAAGALGLGIKLSMVAVKYVRRIVGGA
ncbi:hypothetical protein [Novosphingobium naphthalenivorans]|uniref:hypothetical protein n=1 Tax=Novosphingobium naphthalenivorans TaxID=273168 RepID=UPI00082F5BFF|nr:hypothetical protein [Novosphingobium naphthalenivorans]